MIFSIKIKTIRIHVSISLFADFADVLPSSPDSSCFFQLISDDYAASHITFTRTLRTLMKNVSLL